MAQKAEQSSVAGIFLLAVVGMLILAAVIVGSILLVDELRAQRAEARAEQSIADMEKAMKEGTDAGIRAGKYFEQEVTKAIREAQR